MGAHDVPTSRDLPHPPSGTPPREPPEPRPDRGWIAPDVAEEHPGLELLSWTVPLRRARRSPDRVRDLLAGLSTRVDGPAVLHAHRDDAPAAHRTFLRAIGRDVDEDPSPQELVYRRRIQDGGFRFRGVPEDLLLVVLCETGVPVYALDADLVRGGLGIRRSLRGELPVPDGVDPGRRRPEPVVVDDRGLRAELLREPLGRAGVSRTTTRATFFCARVPGLADLRVDEAVWLCRSLGG